MQALVRILRHMGAALPRSVVDAERWTECRLRTTTPHGARALCLFGIAAKPDAEPAMALYSPVVARVEDESLIIRGFERVEAGGRVAAVLQEWAVRPRESLGPSGKLSPLAKERRDDLPAQRPVTFEELFGADFMRRRPGEHL